MPDFDHEVPLRAFRRQPGHAFEKLIEWTGFSVPDYDSIKPDSEALTDVRPVEFNCDAVIVCRDSQAKPVFALIIEMQRGIDAEKPYSWVAYLANLRRRYKCEVGILVICTTQAIYRWATHIETPEFRGLTIQPYVLGPAQIPEAVGDQARDGLVVETILSLIVHRDSPHRTEVLHNFNFQLQQMPKEEAIEYARDVYPCLDKEDVEVLRMVMMPEVYPYQRILLGESAAAIEAEAEARGEARGEAQGEANMLLHVLDGRSIELSTEQRQKVEQCTDREQLKTWLGRALGANTADQVFDS